MSTFRLGLFVIVTLLVLAGGVFWIGAKQFLFQSTYPLNAEFANVGGLFEGSVVRVGGIQQGAVRRIQLPNKPDQKVRVTMDLTAATKDVIREDSIAQINSEGLIGDKYVEITFGSPDSPAIKNNATVGSEPPLQISDLMAKTNTILDSAKGAMSNIERVSESFSSIATKIDQGKGTAGALVNDKTLYSSLTSGVSAMQEDAQALKKNFLLRGFFKNRGYEDSSQLNKYSLKEFPSADPTKAFAYDGEKLFDKPTTAKLKNGKLLTEAGKYLETNPFGLVLVAAFTDAKGDSETDRKLTEARAMVARDYLVQNFKLDDTKVKTMGMGKSAEIKTASEIQILIYPPAGPGKIKK